MTQYGIINYTKDQGPYTVGENLHRWLNIPLAEIESLNRDAWR